MEEQGQDFDPIAGALGLLEQLLMPAWADLIALVPWLFLGLLALALLGLAVAWRRAGARTRSRVARPLAAGPPPPGVHLPGPSRWPFVAPIGVAIVLLALILPQRDEAGTVTLPFSPLLMLAGLAIAGLSIVGWLLDAMREWRSTERGHAAAGQPALEGGAAPALAAGETAVAVRELPAEPPPGVHLPGPSPWPFFAPIGMMVMLFGLILHPALAIAGLLLSIIAAAGWYRDAGREYRSTEQLGHAVPETRDPVKAWPRALVPVFAVIIGLAVLVAATPIAFAWLDTLRPAEPGATPVPVPAQPEVYAFTALSFDRTELIVPCCRDFELVFHNEQDGVPHDVWIATDASMSETLFEGEDVIGIESVTYQVPTLAEGDYYFWCSIHPNMNGRVVAVPENGAAPDGGNGGNGGNGEGNGEGNGGSGDGHGGPGDGHGGTEATPTP